MTHARIVFEDKAVENPEDVWVKDCRDQKLATMDNFKEYQVQAPQCQIWLCRKIKMLQLDLKLDCETLGFENNIKILKEMRFDIASWCIWPYRPEASKQRSSQRLPLLAGVCTILYVYIHIYIHANVHLSGRRTWALLHANSILSKHLPKLLCGKWPLASSMTNGREHRQK